MKIGKHNIDNYNALTIVIGLTIFFGSVGCPPASAFKADPHHVVCFAAGPQLVQGPRGPAYAPLFELDTLEAPVFTADGDADVQLVSGQVARLRMGAGTCYALPGAAPPAPPASAGRRTPPPPADDETPPVAQAEKQRIEEANKAYPPNVGLKKDTKK